MRQVYPACWKLAHVFHAAVTACAPMVNLRPTSQPKSMSPTAAVGTRGVCLV